MRLRLSPGTVARVLRNLGWVPGRDLNLPYIVALDSTDYPLGTVTMAAATLTIAEDFGSQALLTKSITTIVSADGQITDAGASGTGALHFLVTAGELSSYRGLGPLAYEVVVTDSRGLQATLDEGSLVALPSTAGLPVDHVTIAPSAARLDLTQTQQLTVTPFDVNGTALTGRTITYQSSNAAVATVSPTGLVTGVTVGAAVITATSEGKSANITVTVPAVDHIVLDPVGPLALAWPATQQMTATLYDIDNNVLGNRVVVWSSSDDAIVAVDATGFVSVEAAGVATVTATAEGKTASLQVTASVPAALALTLDFAPLTTRTDLAEPTVLVPDDPGNSGYQLNIPKMIGCGTMGVTRAVFPKTVDEWGSYAAIDHVMGATDQPSVNFAVRTQVAGLYQNTIAWQFVPNSAFGHASNLGVIWHDGDATKDSQDYTTYKRSMACMLKAATPADVGGVVRVNALDSALFPGSNGWWSGNFAIKFVDVTLTAEWQPVVITFDNHAQFDGIIPSLATSMPSSTAPLVSYQVAAYTSWNWQAHETDDESNWLRPLPFHETLGVLTQFQHRNSVPSSDDPAVYGSTVKAPTAVAQPDSNRHYGGLMLQQYTVPNGSGITTGGPYRAEHLTDAYPSNESTGAVWLMWYIEPGTGALPADGALKAYAIPQGIADSDNFDRADTTGGFGAPWDEITNLGGISGNRGYYPSGTNGFALRESGKSDCTVKIRWISPQLGVDRPRLVFRATDVDHQWFIDPETTTSVSLYKNPGTGLVFVASGAHTWATGDVPKVVCQGDQISVYVNDVLVIGPITDAFNETATKHGVAMVANGAGLFFDEYEVSAALTPYGPVSLVRDSESVLRRANGGAFYRARVPVNVASEGYLDFTGRIVNESGAQLVFNATRFAMVAESPRSAGWHNAWVPKRTVNGSALSEAAFSEIHILANLVDNHDGVWVMRVVPAFNFGEVHNLNGAGGLANPERFGPGFWQSGPFGSADYSFDCSIEPTAAGISFVANMKRGSPAVGSWTNWGASITWSADDPTLFPAFLAFDIAFAWKDDQLVAFGIGEGADSAAITWLQNGDTFHGGVVAISSEIAQTWNMGDQDSHIGLGADRDRIRQFGGWIQGIMAASAVVTATVKDSIAYHVAHRFRERQDYR